MGLTPKQKAVFEFICNEIQESGISPSYDEIRSHFNLASYNSVQKYIKQLESKGFIKTPWGSRKRAIEVVKRKKTALFKPPVHSTNLPLLGKVAAGLPLEAVENTDSLDVPNHLLKKAGQHFALKVEGDSMIGEGIFDGDVVVIKSQPEAKNGDPVVASLDNEVTVKRYFKKPFGIELRPSNPSMEPIRIPREFLESQPPQVEFRILGLVTGLLRQY